MALENDADHEAALAFERGARSRDAEIAHLKTSREQLSDLRAHLSAQLTTATARIASLEAAREPLANDQNALDLIRTLIHEGLKALNGSDHRVRRCQAERGTCECTRIPDEQLVARANGLAMVIVSELDVYQGGDNEPTDPLRGRAGT